MYEIKNVYMIEEKNVGKMCLFGEVVSDARFPEGHHIVTSDIVDFERDAENNIKKVKTQTGSIYKIHNFISSREEFLKYLQDTYTEEKYKSTIAMIEMLENRE